MTTTTTTTEPRPRTRGKGRMTVAIKDAVEIAFGKKNQGGHYLAWLADEHPAVFVNLVSRCIPQAVAIDIHTTIVDLGSEMRIAAETLARLNRPPMIDVTPDTVTPDAPDTPDTVTPDTVPGDTESGDTEPGDTEP